MSRQRQSPSEMQPKSPSSPFAGVEPLIPANATAPSDRSLEVPTQTWPRGAGEIQPKTRWTFVANLRPRRLDTCCLAASTFLCSLEKRRQLPWLAALHLSLAHIWGRLQTADGSQMPREVGYHRGFRPHTGACEYATGGSSLPARYAVWPLQHRAGLATRPSGKALTLAESLETRQTPTYCTVLYVQLHVTARFQGSSVASQFTALRGASDFLPLGRLARKTRAAWQTNPRAILKTFTPLSCIHNPARCDCFSLFGLAGNPKARYHIPPTKTRQNHDRLREC